MDRHGDAGDDTLLYGGAGDDKLYGCAGTDLLNGGSGGELCAAVAR